MHTSPARTPWWRVLYIQVLLAVVAGILLGWLFPDTGKTLKPLGDGFIKLIKMMIAPVIFCTVVHGVASMGDLKKLGRVGGKTLLYFEVVSTLALVIGLVVVNLLKPGAGFNVEVADLGAKAADAARENAGKAQGLSTVDFLLGIIPGTFVGAFAGGDLLQVLFIALLTAFGLAGMGERGKSLLHGIDRVSEVFFAIMRIVVKAAPVGAFGAMAFTIGSYGLESLQRLLALMLGFYITAGFFVVVVLGLIARWCGFSIFRFLAYIKEELLLVLGTSSSETALPLMIQKLRGLGCAPATVGLVVPTGYSFNLDGTNIYMAMAAVFLATDAFLNLTRATAPPNIVASAKCYGGTFMLFSRYAAERGIDVRWVTDELNLDAWASQIDSGTRFVFGEMPSNPGLGVFDIAGVAVASRITSLRKVDWGSMRANFFVLYPVAQLPDVPLTYMSAFKAPETRGFDNALVREFPNITSVDVSATLAQVQRILDQVVRAVEFLFGFTLAAGLVVLFAAITATREERAREFAVMRAVGAQAKLLRQVQRAELAGVGLLAGLLAALVATVVGWSLARFVFNFAWTASPWVPLEGALAGAVLAMLAGWWGLRDVLRRPVVETLRRAPQ